MKAILRGNKIILKSGHTDGASAITSCKVIMAHCQMILDKLEGNEEMSLDTWWTNKIAVSEHEVVQAANYLVSGDMDHDHGTDSE
jgi:hypothetical protein